MAKVPSWAIPVEEKEPPPWATQVDEVGPAPSTPLPVRATPSEVATAGPTLLPQAINEAWRRAAWQERAEEREEEWWNGVFDKITYPFARMAAYAHRTGRGAAQLGTWLTGKAVGVFDEDLEATLEGVTTRLGVPTRTESWAEKERQDTIDEFLARGDATGTALATSYAIGTGGLDVLTGLSFLYTLNALGAGIHPIPGFAGKGAATRGILTKRVLQNALKVATWNFLTTPGDGGERLKTAATTFVYLSTPAVSSFAGTTPKAIFFDNLLNFSISSFLAKSYPQAIDEAKALAKEAGDEVNWMKYITKTGAIQTFVSDFVSTLGTRPLRPSADIGYKNELVEELVKGGEASAERVMSEVGKANQAVELMEKGAAGATKAVEKAEEVPGWVVVDYIRDLGNDGALSAHEANRVSNKTFVKEMVDLDELRKNDPSFDDYVKSGEVRDFGEENLYSPPVVGEMSGKPNQLLDGYNRLSQRYRAGERQVEVWTEKKIEAPSPTKIVIPWAPFSRWAKENRLGEKAQTAAYRAADANDYDGMIKAIPLTKRPAFENFLEKQGITKPVEPEVEVVNVKKVRGSVARILKSRGFNLRDDSPDAEHRKLYRRLFPGKWKGDAKVSMKDLSAKQLEVLLEASKTARPEVVVVNGKKLNPIKERTENKVASLVATMEREGALTEAQLRGEMDKLDIPAGVQPKFVFGKRFITEGQGKALLKRLRNYAPFFAFRNNVQEALAKNPDARAAWGRYVERVGGLVWKGKGVKVSPFFDMRYYTGFLQERTGVPFFESWMKINEVALQNSALRDGLHQELVDAVGEKAFRDIDRSEASKERIDQYIESQSPLKQAPKAPDGLTDNELKLARVMVKRMREAQPMVRFVRFVTEYEKREGTVYDEESMARSIQKDIPNAPLGELEKAIDIFEGQGEKALAEYLSGLEWGIIEDGYAPHVIHKARMNLFPAKETQFSEGHIRTRTTIDFGPQELDIFKRYSMYFKQMLSLYTLRPHVRSFMQLFADNSDKLADPKGVGKNLSLAINELKGYTEGGGVLTRAMRKLYAQGMTAVFWDVKKWTRNLFQNLAFYPRRRELFDPRNKKLSEERLEYFKTFVSQKMGLLKHWFMEGEKPFPLLDKLSKIARATSLYPWTDETNRVWCFTARINSADRAIARFERSGDRERFVRDLHLEDLEPVQRKMAMEKWATDGVEGLARFVAKEVTNNVHFMYDRSQRAVAEMGPAGRIIGNLLTFPRSYYQRIYLNLSKLNPMNARGKGARMAGLKDLINLAVIGIAAGEIYKRVTGTERNPYDPLKLAQWSPGGLAFGGATQLADGIRHILDAAQGDPEAVDKAIVAITRNSELYIPFYKTFIDSMDVVSGMENVDRYNLRRLHEAINERYRVAGGRYKVERDLLESIQHSLFGARSKEEDVKREGRGVRRGR